MSIFKTIPPFSLVYQSQHEGCTNVLLINNLVQNANLVMNSCNPDTFPIIYSSTSTKAELYEVLTSRFIQIDRIGFFFVSPSTAENTTDFLDSQPFFTSNAKPYNENMSFIVSLINNFKIKNADFLACNTLNFPNWKEYYDVLHNETGIVIGASDNKTGNIKYGGDWIMESTSQDVETIYFTKCIEYYTYLLDNPTWATGLNLSYDLLVYDGHMYLTDYFHKRISQLSLLDG